MHDRMETHNARPYAARSAVRIVSGPFGDGPSSGGSHARRGSATVMPAVVQAIPGVIARGLIYFLLTLLLMAAATWWLTDGFKTRPTWAWGHAFHQTDSRAIDR